MKNKFNDNDDYLSIINDNDNVSKTNDFKEFFIVCGGFFSLLIIVFFIFNFLSDSYIQHISPLQQIKLEKIIAKNIKIQYPSFDDDTYDSQLIYLDKIKNEIIHGDKNLQNRSKLDLHIIKSHEVNAFVNVDGNIYFTTGLLNKISDKKELAFVLAHELGHYSHRDNLTAFSREISLITIASLFSIGQNSSVQKTINGLVNFTAIKYSKTQEINADLYASNIVKKIYGTNNSGIKFFKDLEREDKNPEFVYLFANHPKPKDRIKALQNQ